MWKLCIICNYFRISYVLKNPEIQKTLMPDSGYGLCHCETMLHNFCLVHWAHTHNDLCNWSRINLCMCPANESRRYNVTSFLIDWAHTQNDPRLVHWIPCTCLMDSSLVLCLSYWVHSCGRSGWGCSRGSVVCLAGVVGGSCSLQNKPHKWRNAQGFFQSLIHWPLGEAVIILKL